MGCRGDIAVLIQSFGNAMQGGRAEVDDTSKSDVTGFWKMKGGGTEKGLGREWGRLWL